MNSATITIDPDNATITIDLLPSFGEIMSMCEDLPREEVSGWRGWMGPYWVPLLAVNLRTYLGVEWVEEPDFDTQEQIIRFSLTADARGQGVNGMTKVCEWITGYLQCRAGLTIDHAVQMAS